MLIDIAIFGIVLFLGMYLLAIRTGYTTVPQKWLPVLVLLTALVFVPYALTRMMSEHTLFLCDSRYSKAVELLHWAGGGISSLRKAVGIGREPSPKDQLQLIRQRIAQVRVLLSDRIPAHRRLAEESVRAARAALESCSAAEGRNVLEQEIRSTATELVALDRRQEQCKTALVILGSTERQLDLCLLSEQTLGPETRKALEEGARALQQTGALVELRLVDVGKTTPGLSADEVDRKLQELR